MQESVCGTDEARMCVLFSFSFFFSAVSSFNFIQEFLGGLIQTTMQKIEEINIK